MRFHRLATGGAGPADLPQTAVRADTNGAHSIRPAISCYFRAHVDSTPAYPTWSFPSIAGFRRRADIAAALLAHQVIIVLWRDGLRQDHAVPKIARRGRGR